MAKLEIELHESYANVTKDGVLVGIFEAEPGWDSERLEKEVTEWVRSGMK